jgi:hypothetical protein
MGFEPTCPLRGARFSKPARPTVSDYLPIHDNAAIRFVRENSGVGGSRTRNHEGLSFAALPRFAYHAIDEMMNSQMSFNSSFITQHSSFIITLSSTAQSGNRTHKHSGLSRAALPFAHPGQWSWTDSNRRWSSCRDAALAAGLQDRVFLLQARGGGIEPPFAGSKPDGLPLADPRTHIVANKKPGVVRDTGLITPAGMRTGCHRRKGCAGFAFTG